MKGACLLGWGFLLAQTLRYGSSFLGHSFSLPCLNVTLSSPCAAGSRRGFFAALSGHWPAALGTALTLSCPPSSTTPLAMVGKCASIVTDFFFFILPYLVCFSIYFDPIHENFVFPGLN